MICLYSYNPRQNKDRVCFIGLPTTSFSILIVPSKVNSITFKFTRKVAPRDNYIESGEFILTAETSSGDVICDFPTAKSGSRIDKYSLEGTVSSNTHKVVIKTVSRDIAMEK